MSRMWGAFLKNRPHAPEKLLSYCFVRLEPLLDNAWICSHIVCDCDINGQSRTSVPTKLVNGCLIDVIVRKEIKVMEEIINITPDDIEIISKEDYSSDISECFANVPNIAKPLLIGAKKSLSEIEKMLYSAPAFVSMVRASVPEYTLKAILTNEQKMQLANGSLKLMTKKDGSLMASLVNPKNNRIVTNISLESVQITPALSEAMANYATQMQMAQIAEDIRLVQKAVEEVRQGQEYDRLAIAYSCQQKLLQAMQIKNPELRTHILMQIALSAEDTRNMLMQTQSANLKFIQSQPESDWGKLLRGDKPEKIEQRMNEIRESLLAVNMVSLCEAIAYQQLGEKDAAKQSLQYYADYLHKAYLSVPNFVERLDLLDPSPTNYWSNTLPRIKDKINALPCYNNIDLIEGE